MVWLKYLISLLYNMQCGPLKPTLEQIHVVSNHFSAYFVKYLFNMSTNVPRPTFYVKWQFLLVSNGTIQFYIK